MLTSGLFSDLQHESAFDEPSSFQEQASHDHGARTTANATNEVGEGTDESTRLVCEDDENRSYKSTIGADSMHDSAGSTADKRQQLENTTK